LWILQKYLHLNEAEPIVAIVFGLPGSGKSYFASHLAEKLNAEYLNSDKVRLSLYPVRTYSEEEKLSVYQTLLAMTKESLRTGRSVIVDGTFYKESIRQEYKDELTAGTEVFFIEVIAEEGLIYERLRQHRPYSEADESVYRKIKGQWEPYTEDHLILQSTNHNLDEMLGHTLKYLKNKHDLQ
jgi:predicted kinase